MLAGLDLCTAAFSLLAAYSVVQLLRLATADADLALLWRGKHKPDAFRGKVVWLTGASQGFGEVLARYLAQRGARLILSSRCESQRGSG
jgi:dehydrogenase/reductase SDR family protein 7